MAHEFALQAFESRLQRALERVRVVLDAAKAPCLAGDVHHQYDDKYFLVECMTNAAVASQLNSLSALGLRAEHVAKLQEWAEASAVSLQFRSEERCSFLREETRDVESPTSQVEELSVGGAVRAALTSKVVTKVTEYFWQFEVSYELLAIRGVGEQPADRISLLARTSRDELKTTTKSSPRPEAKVPAVQDEVNVSWLFRQLPADATTPLFKVDRSHAKCATPRRNPAVDAARHCFGDVLAWAKRVAAYTRGLLQSQPDPSRRLDLKAVEAEPLVVSVLPLLRGEDSAASSAAPAEAGQAAPVAEPAPSNVLARLPASDEVGALLGVADTNRLLAEEARSLAETRTALAEAFPADGSVASVVEATLVSALRHCAEVCSQWMRTVDYVEGLLRKQLIAAIGKEVSPADFAEYMRFHNRKLLAEEYAPIPFCFAVRRSGAHAPEGTVSIEQDVTGPGGDSSMAAPIVTLVAQSTSSHPMHFPISASTDVRFHGERYLHAWLSHQFSGQSGSKLSLVSRARQFSSMLVLVGRIASASAFEPKYAAIVQNKDELTIPLDLSTIPTPKEFKDAIESLSPEQQAFAKAFRAMQLESTLFGVLLIQIKPQLEKVLNLPADSLTKEIKLTQDLMQLFIKYQIPSDLLSFDDGADADGVEVVAPTQTEKLEAVKGHVKAMHEMIEKSKEEEVAERRREVRYDAADLLEEECESRSIEMTRKGGGKGAAMGKGAAKGGFGASGPPPPPPGARMMFCGAPAAAPAAPGGMMGGGMFGAAPPTGGGLFGAAPAPQMAFAAAAAPPMGGGLFGAAPGAAAPPTGGGLFGAAPGAAAPPTGGGLFGAAPGAAAPPTGGGLFGAAPAPPMAAAAQARQPRESQEPEGAVDYTQVPREMDKQFERLDTDSALRPTIISPGDTWTKKAQKALLASPTTSSLHTDGQKREKDAAFDLLDALTKSGALPVDHASLHVVVAATHCFDKTVTETVVQDNMNPIDKVERSTLIMASTIHQKPAVALIRQAQYSRVSATSPMLFVEDGTA